MEVWFSVRAYDLYGGDRTLSLIGNVLEKTAPANHSLRTLEITAWFATNRPPRKTLESLYDDFHRQMIALPATRYFGRKHKLTIDYRSSIGPAERVLQTYDLDYQRFAAAFDELLGVVDLLHPQLLKKKAVNAAEFAQLVRLARAQAPSSAEALAAFDESEKERRAAERAQKSPWELLGIEWEDYHPDARNVLDDPFFWEVANDYAPNGNDTGADLLHDVRESRLARRDPKGFLDSVVARWGMKEMVEVALRRPHETLTDDDEMAITTYDEAAIALPFALIKLYGSVEPRAIQLGLDAIERERHLADARGWVLPDERVAALRKIEQKLRELGAGSASPR